MVSELLFDTLLSIKQWNFEEISKLSSTSTMIVAWAAPVFCCCKCASGSLTSALVFLELSSFKASQLLK
jgi:glucose uptake protein GlcU